MVVPLVRLLAGVGFLAGNAFFVGTEFALTRIRQYPMSAFEGDPGLERAWDLTDELEVYLSGCQVGITICSIGLGVVAEPALTPLILPLVSAVGLGAATAHAAAFGVAFLTVNVLHLVVGEQAPTYLGIERARGVARRVAPVIAAWTWLMWPVIWLADRTAKALLGLFGVSITRSWTAGEGGGEVGRAELKQRMGDVLARGGLSLDRRREVLAALAIGDTPVREVMVPREEIVALSVRDDAETVLAKLRANVHTRYPLVDEGLEDPVGTIYAPAVLGRDEDLRGGDLDLTDVASPALTVETGSPVADVIDTLQAEAQELALVVEDGRVVGLVTATDLLESIVGELRDPLDREG